MEITDFRVPSVCSHRSGSRPHSRATYLNQQHDKMIGSKSSVHRAVEGAMNGFTKRPGNRQDKILSCKLNLDCKSYLRTPRTNRSNKENVERFPSETNAAFRPVSAPAGTRRKRLLTRSSIPTDRHVRTSTPIEEDDMFDVVKAVKEAKSFQEDIELFQNLEKSLKNPDGDEKKDAAPVFNKRLFASQGTVIMTEAARRLMAINSKANQICDIQVVLSKRDLQCLRCVTEGLKLIHKGHDFVKDVLSRVVTYEIYKAFQYVPIKSWEEVLSCYYILNGAVEVTYDLRSRESRNVYQANIIYSHGTGEYLGLVSPEGPSEDLTPPATIYTKELTQFIRVDRQRFHKLMEMATAMIDKQKRDYVRSHSFLTKVSDKVKEKLLHKFTIQEFQPNRVLLTQGEITEFLFIIMSGRCQTYREVYIPEADKEVLFYLTSRDTDDFFGEECVLDHDPSICTIVTATTTVCLKLHRSALQMVNKDKLTKFIEAERHEFITDHELRNMGYKDCVWNKFKHGQIKETLKEGGKLCYLTKDRCNAVLERPPSDEDIYVENKRRFVLKGSQFEPFRTQSAIVRRSQQGMFPIRPHTVLGNRVSEETENQKGETLDQTEDVPDMTDSPSPPPKPTSLMSASKAKELDKQIDRKRPKSVTLARIVYQAMENKDALMKMLDEHGDMGIHLKQAWKSENAQEMQNFMKNGVLVTMTSEDIVRKAKALADTYADKWKKKSTGNEEEEWNTILHAENKQAKMLISANKLRLKDLKRRMTELQKRRERDRERRSPRKQPSDTSDEHPEFCDQIKSDDTVELVPHDLKDNQNEDIGTDREVPEEILVSGTDDGTENAVNTELTNKLTNTVNDIEVTTEKESHINVESIEDLESRDSFCVDIDREVKITKSTPAASRPDSAIGSMGSEDTEFESTTTDIQDRSKLDDSVELSTKGFNGLHLKGI